jgi:hypothetical protein
MRENSEYGYVLAHFEAHYETGVEHDAVIAFDRDTYDGLQRKVIRELDFIKEMFLQGKMTDTAAISAVLKTRAQLNGWDFTFGINEGDQILVFDNQYKLIKIFKDVKTDWLKSDNPQRFTHGPIESNYHEWYGYAKNKNPMIIIRKKKFLGSEHHELIRDPFAKQEFSEWERKSAVKKVLSWTPNRREALKRQAQKEEEQRHKDWLKKSGLKNVKIWTPKK